MGCKITCTARERFTDKKKNTEVNFRVRSRSVSSASDCRIAGPSSILGPAPRMFLLLSEEAIRIQDDGSRRVAERGGLMNA
jgi:hypothetical protein